MATYVEGNIVYEVSLDTKNLLANAGTVREQLLKLKANGQEAAQGLDKVDKSAGNASNSLGKLTTIAKAVSAALVSSQIIAYAQSWNELEDRIANTGATAAQTKDIMEQLLETSNRNGRSIEESSELYIRLSNSMKEMGYSTSGTLDYIDTLSNLLTINKTNTLAAESAMNALTRAQMKGKLSGIEAESVFNAMPSILQTLAKQFSKTGKAVTEIDVRNMAKNGEISMRQFANAAIAANEDTAALADNMRNNVSDGITRITNNLKQYFGELNNATGGTKLIVDALILMSQHVNVLATGVGVLGAIYAGKYITSLAAATKQSAAKVIADIKQAAATSALAKEELAELAVKGQLLTAERNALIASQATTTSKTQQAVIAKRLNAISLERTALVNQEAAAQARLVLSTKLTSMALNGLKSAMNLLGGPAGILLIAAGAMYSWIASNEAAKEKALGLGDYIEELRKKFAGLNEEQKKLELSKLDVKIDEQNEAIKRQQVTLEFAKREYEDYAKRANGFLSSLFTSQEGLNKKTLEYQQAQADLKTEQDGLNSSLKAKADLTNQAATATEQLSESTKNLNQSFSTTAYDKQLELLNNLLEKKKEGVELSKVNAEIENGIFKDLEPQQKAELQRVADLVDKMRERQQLEKDRQVEEGQKFGDQVMYDAKSDLEKIDADQQAKIERLNYYNDLGAYNEQQYQDRLTAINEEAAKKRKKIDDDAAAAKLRNTQDILNASSSLFDGLAEIMKTSEGKQSASYKAMFSISKGFQIASSLVALYGAAIKAMDDPLAITPAQKMTNYASVMAAGAGFVSQISSLNYGGGREHGGGISAGSYYRVGENNKPEILQSGSRQYLIPGENGKVISNKDLTSSNGGVSLDWTFIVENNSSGTEVQQPDIDRDKRIVKWAVTEVANSVRNKQGDVWNAFKTTTNVKSRL